MKDQQSYSIFFVNFYNFTIRFVASVNIDFDKILTTDT